MKILVTTPTGNVGRNVVRELFAPEFSVRVLVRDPARLPHDIRDLVEVVQGSAEDTSTLHQALEDVEAVFWCVPPAPIHETDMQGHYERFSTAAAGAICEAKTPRVVTMSTCGKRRVGDAGPISGLHAMEDLLNQSGAAIRHVRCSWPMESFLERVQAICEQGTLSYPIPGHIPIPMVAAADVADVALRWLVRRDWKGIQAVAAHGPEELSFGQAAAALERTLERQVRYLESPAAHYVRTLLESGASAQYAHSLLQMFHGMAQGLTRAEPGADTSTTPTTFAAWTERELRSWLGRSPYFRRLDSDGHPYTNCLPVRLTKHTEKGKYEYRNNDQNERTDNEPCRFEPRVVRNSS